MSHCNRQVETALYVVLYTFTTGALILLAPGVMRAQTASATPSAQSIREARRLEMEARQRALWNLEKEARRRTDRPAADRLVYQQAKEDFETLQLTSYAMCELSDASSSPHYG